MKFTNGHWLMEQGVTAYGAAEFREMEWDGGLGNAEVFVYKSGNVVKKG